MSAHTKIKGIFYRSFWTALLFIVFSIQSTAQDETNEYKIKAMFVLNFMKYIEWPSESNISEFRIGVVGESEMYDALVSMSANRLDDKKIRIERVGPNSIENFQIIIIPRSENKSAGDWITKCQGKGTLIIAEESKNKNLAAINLLNINNKIRFEINNTQARLGGVRISSKLAELAVTVHP